ncbi:hypothetical protein HanXRQr2_Chr03g0096751 [Helianthus annuus]|uniref:Uncharacterized protein n=1 Tax=Helianthus annuus TaxID=4232 RepID=A0A251V9G8_HELAN|nr:hypothetical protein HanXRQr2_Chr03g0096751 [Helianthus annuus]KAJ0942549.1 hypothetical protein HanPSC8_Chr03g0093291 [Helianthus annuus]
MSFPVSNCGDLSDHSGTALELNGKTHKRLSGLPVTTMNWQGAPTSPSAYTELQKVKVHTP